ncbi:flagellar basal body-associated protein FliL [Salinimonas chungwhensis]|uniref:flagellar basal body-associated protein FliL n=1 Tax=Salinimonas chungwhensis TaxID=265425 RepID=UPI00036946F7|nr:flagellar basal body-associated protein FliL [Salinimonas chungwhensis]
MAEEELQIEESGKKSKLPLIVIVVVALLGAGGAAWYFLFSGSDEPVPQDSELTQQEAGVSDEAPAGDKAKMGSALYVPMPRPFTFNVPGTGRDRLVEIKVQLMVRGSDNEEMAKMHIPLIEGTLLQVFSASSADELITEAGKVALRERAVTEVQKVLNETVGADVVEQVLFTGFVMQ